MQERSDEQLVEAYRNGETEALRTLILRYQDDLLRFLYRLTGDRIAAEDVFQEAFFQVHLSAQAFDTARRFKPWLFTIAANKGRDYLRKRNRRQEVDLLAPVDGGRGGDNGSGSETFVDLMQVDVPQPSEAMSTAERDALVQRAIGRLPLSLREILLLAYFQRLSYSQIAEDLEIPVGTVKSRLHAAVAAFAKAWQAVAKPDETTPS